MNFKPIDILFLVLLFISIIVIGFLLSMPIGILLEGMYNKYTLLQMGIFIPASIIAYIHLYTVYAESKKVTKNMVYTVIGYIIVFPIAYTIVVALGAVLLH